MASMLCYIFGLPQSDHTSRSKVGAPSERVGGCLEVARDDSCLALTSERYKGKERVCKSTNICQHIGRLLGHMYGSMWWGLGVTTLGSACGCMA